MNVERAPGGTSLIDVLDRVLDKGITFDPWVRAHFNFCPIDLSNSEIVARTFTPLRPTFGSHTSSESALPVNDDDDDDDGGSGGSSGAPALLYVEREPRRRPPGAPRRTGRKA